VPYKVAASLTELESLGAFIIPHNIMQVLRQGVLGVYFPQPLQYIIRE